MITIIVIDPSIVFGRSNGNTNEWNGYVAAAAQCRSHLMSIGPEAKRLKAILAKVRCVVA